MKIESPVLERLGPIPFWRGERRCLDTLGEMYRRAREKAQLALRADALKVASKRPERR